jgi:orotate phosphoribosyltransferase
MQSGRWATLVAAAQRPKYDAFGQAIGGSRARIDMDYDRGRLIELVRRDAVQFGDFTLASGQKSSVYIDCRQVTLSSAGAALIGAGVIELLLAAGEPVDAVGGLTLGADPIVAATLVEADRRRLNLRGFLVRKEAKHHGTGKRIEGPIRSGDRVAIVEDVSTTGASAMAAIEAVESIGCRVECVIAVLDRLAGAAQHFTETGYRFVSLLTLTDLGL